VTTSTRARRLDSEIAPFGPGLAPVPNETIRIVHVITIPESFGLMRGQLSYMAARGVAISAISSPGEALDALAERERVPVFAVPMARRITPFADAVAVLRIYRVLRQIRPDIVHAQTPKGGLLGTIAAWLARVPVRIYHIRGLPLTVATGMRRVLLLVTERIACGLASQVLCVSHSLRAVAVAEGLCPAGKIKVLGGGSGNGVDADERYNPQRIGSQRETIRNALGLPADAIVAGFVGRIVRDKGVIELTRAWSKIREEFPNLHLLVVGRFEDQDPIPDDVGEALRTDPRVRVVPWWDDMPALYSAMDLVVLPTYREGFPNVPLEAAAMGLPVVATNVPGCIDSVRDGVTGTLVPARDPVALEEAIRSYLRNPERGRAHGHAGRERVLRDFRQQAVWDALRAEYSRLMRRSASNS
jgi:glycosyltransferase involved in cell wall biosynthesis